MKLLKIIFFSIIIVAVLSYSYYQTKDYLTGPVLELTEPADNATLFQSRVTIKGYTKNISYLNMNGKQIFTDPSGQFSEETLLAKGLNIISIIAKDKYERENKKILRLVYLVK